MYELMRFDNAESIRMVQDGVVLGIPMDPANRHYQEYLEWVAEGNTALVIEEDA